MTVKEVAFLTELKRLLNKYGLYISERDSEVEEDNEGGGVFYFTNSCNIDIQIDVNMFEEAK